MPVDGGELAPWLAFVDECLNGSQQSQEFPHREVAELLRHSLAGDCCTFNVVGADWADRVEGCWPPGRLPAEPPGGRRPDATWQPLLRWYALTLDGRPQTLGRVPADIAGDRMKQVWDSVVRPFGVSAQFAVPVTVGAGGVRAYVLGRDGRDLDGAERALAHLVQPALGTLFRQHEALTRAARRDAAPEAGLTARETAVLALLGEGLTAEAIGRRLGSSPRTVHKHLEHLYRKLGVRDRLMAVRTGRELGVLSEVDACREDDLQLTV
ncbi:hypothetical protein NUM3379_01590 [Kineococcus sp. NUM-3379]